MKITEQIDTHRKLLFEHLDATLQSFKPESLMGIRQTATALQDVVRVFEEQSTAVESDAELTLVGKENRRRDLGRKALHELDVLVEQRVDVVKRQIEEATSDLMPKRASVDAVTGIRQEMRQAELRADLRHADPLEVEAMYLTAAEDSDLVAAVEGAPPVLRVTTEPGSRRRRTGLVPLVTAEVIAQRQRERAAAARPAAAQRLSDLETVRDGVLSLVGTARKEIQRAANLGG